MATSPCARISVRAVRAQVIVPANVSMPNARRCGHLRLREGCFRTEINRSRSELMDFCITAARLNQLAKREAFSGLAFVSASCKLSTPSGLRLGHDMSIVPMSSLARWPNG